jgi:hypothetical protein
MKTKSLLHLTRKEVIKNFSKYRYIVNGNNFLKYYPDFDIEYYKTNNNLIGLSNKEIIKDFVTSGQFKSKQYRNKYTIVFYLDRINDSVGGASILLYTVYKINQMQHPQISAKIYTADGLNIRHKFVGVDDYATPFEFTNDHTIAVYAENVRGNPLKAKHVIRWILLEEKYGFVLKKFWRKKDRVCSWEPSDWYPRLTLPMHPKNMFENLLIDNQNNKTIENICLVKKARLLLDIDKDLNLHPADSLSLESVDVFDPNKMIEIFKASKYFYCYDVNSFWAVIAPMLGCITILCSPKQKLDRETYFKKTMLYHPSGYIHDAGIAIGNSKEEIEYAQKTLHIANQSINILIDLYEQDFRQWLNTEVIEYLNKINNKVYVS